MRVLFVTLGSRGDVEPCLALALGLRKRGHEVTIATHGRYEDWINNAGIGFAPVTGSADRLMRGLVAAGSNGLRYLRNWRAFFLPVLHQALDDVARAAEALPADLIIGATFGQPAFFVAELLGIGCLRASFQPFDRTRHFPAPMMPQRLRLGGPANWVTHMLVEFVAHQAFRSALNRWRAGRGLPRLSFWRWPYERVAGRPVPVLYAISPALLERPPDWGPHIHLTGSWLLPSPAGWQPPKRLKDFLAAKPKPVCISFGSMVTPGLTAVVTRLLTALDSLEQRVVVIAGWETLPARVDSEHVLLLPPAPHEYVLPLMSLLIHHGGAGTVAAAAQAGLPALVIPFFGDHPYWGHQVTRLGVGLTLRQSQADGSRLKDTLRRLLTEPAFAARAAAIGAQMRAEQGVEAAVALIERYDMEG